MPRIARIFIRLSLIYLVIGATLGASLLLMKITGEGMSAWGILLIAHQTIMIHGWFQHLIFGSAYWIFPKLLGTTTHDPEQQRPFEMILAVLNGGIILQVLSPLVSPMFTYAGYGLIIMATLAFIAGIWKRVYSPSHRRPHTH